MVFLYIRLSLVNIVCAALMLISIYFIYHTVIGQRGIFVMIESANELANLEKDLENLRVDRLIIENKVKYMKPESLDLDLVEEQAKQELGFANQKESVIIIGGGQGAKQ